MSFKETKSPFTGPRDIMKVVEPTHIVSKDKNGKLSFMDYFELKSKLIDLKTRIETMQLLGLDVPIEFMADLQEMYNKLYKK